jgi:DNA-binding beta-propeller fold protein YncE
MSRKMKSLYVLIFCSAFSSSILYAQSIKIERRILATDTVSTGGVKVPVSTDDAEQENNEMDALFDDDIDAGWEGAPEDQNILTAGLRFRQIDIPQGAKIDSAFLTIWSHEGKSAEDIANINIYVDANVNAPTFKLDSLITKRTLSLNSVKWVENKQWKIWQPYRTPDISSLLKEMIGKPSWKSGNPLAFILAGENQGPSEVENAREFESFENIADPSDGGDGQRHPERIPLLTVYYSLPSVSQVNQSNLTFNLVPLSSYRTGIFDQGAAEIVDFDPISAKIFFTNAIANTLTALNASNPSTLTKAFDISLSNYGGGVNSVSINNGLVAVAMEALVKTDSGTVVFFDTDGKWLKSVKVGALPDMLTFSPDGKKLIIANEGEPNDTYTIDPEGSVSIIDVSGGAQNATVKHINFQSQNGKLKELVAAGIRIYGPKATVAQDLEPEYVTISADNKLAYVTMQENNAMAILDIENVKLLKLVPLGYKNHNLPGNGLDASNTSGKIEIKNHPVFGMYLPDATKFIQIAGKSYIFTANEGDARAYTGFNEEKRISTLKLDPQVFPNASSLQSNNELGRLLSSSAMGDVDNDGDVDQLYSLGGRSFSIWDANTLEQVFDSGDHIEKMTAAKLPTYFNSNHTDNNSFKGRSDDKGPEPEALEFAKLGNDLFVLIGLERIGGIIVYEINDPKSPKFVSYLNHRNFMVDPKSPQAGDLGIEDIKFIPADKSPIKKPLVLVGNEVSGTISLFSINEILSANRDNIVHNGFKVSPNPSAESNVWIEFPEEGSADIQLTDISGRVVLTKENMIGKNYNLDINALSSGVYFASLRQNNTIYLQKLVIARP